MYNIFIKLINRMLIKNNLQNKLIYIGFNKIIFDHKNQEKSKSIENILLIILELK
jgi:hypothetical protein